MGKLLDEEQLFSWPLAWTGRSREVSHATRRGERALRAPVEWLVGGLYSERISSSFDLDRALENDSEAIFFSLARSITPFFQKFSLLSKSQGSKNTLRAPPCALSFAFLFVSVCTADRSRECATSVASLRSVGETGKTNESDDDDGCLVAASKPRKAISFVLCSPRLPLLLLFSARRRREAT